MLESKISSSNANAKPVTAITENSDQQPQSTKCASFGRYSLYALPAPAGFGFLSYIISAKCGMSAFGSLMCGTGVALCSFASCSVMYGAHYIADKNIRARNEAQINKDTEGYTELLRLAGPVTEQPKRIGSLEGSISQDSS